MKINVKIMKQEIFTKLQEESTKVYEMIKNNPSDSSWLSFITGTDDIYDIKQYTIEDFELKYSPNYKDVEFENGVILYEHLHNLPRYLLCSNRFWIWIILEKAYMQSCIAMDLTEGVVRNFWLENDNRRAVMLNVMGRQFFKVELSKNDELKDKYLLTKYLFDNHSIYKNFSYRNICMLPNVSGAILNASYYLFQKYQFKQPEKIVSDFVKNVTRIGSTKLVDIIPEAELFQYLCKKMEPKIKVIYDELNEEN